MYTQEQYDSLPEWMQKDLVKDGDVYKHAGFLKVKKTADTNDEEKRKLAEELNQYKLAEQNRLEEAERISKTVPRVSLVEHEWLEDMTVVSRYLAERELEGYEGAMLRNPNGFYKQGRATMKPAIYGQELVKVKSFVDAEATIVAVHELLRNTNEQTRDERGLAKRSNKAEGMTPAGTLGSIECESNSIRFGVGSGYSQELRDSLWKQRKSLIGKKLKYKYFDGGSKERPRFPVFVGIRDPRD